MSTSGSRDSTSQEPAQAGGNRSPQYLRRFVSWFLDHLYTDLAWAYDLVASVTSLGQWWTWQRAVAGALPDGRLLELGVGTGRLLRELTAEDRSVVGLDRSPQMIRIARRRLRRSGGPLLLLRADALQLPFMSASFAGAYATFPSDYILQPETLRQVLRVLEPGGVFVVIPSARIRGNSLPDRLAGWLYRITGQSGAPDPAWRRRLGELGVAGRLEMVEQPRAQVLRLVIVKPGAGADKIARAQGGADGKC